jgi:hypothetical protein
LDDDQLFTDGVAAGPADFVDDLADLAVTFGGGDAHTDEAGAHAATRETVSSKKFLQGLSSETSCKAAWNAGGRISALIKW